MTRYALVLPMLLFSACTLVDKVPELPTPPEPAPVTQAPAPAPRREVFPLALTAAQVAQRDLEDEAPQVATLSAPPVLSQQDIPDRRPPTRKERPLRPEQIIRQGEQAALVQPTARGYFGGQVIQRYVWMPGKIYAVYVSPTKKTRIMLPQGEYTEGTLALDDDTYDVGKMRIKKGETLTDIFFVRPWKETYRAGQVVDVGIVTEAGHAFDLRLISSPTGMHGIAFDVTPVIHLPSEEEEHLVLPRPAR